MVRREGIPHGKEGARVLTDAQKTAIRLEEAYRAGVRKELGAKRADGALAALWRCLNSNLVVWFLGSVVATGIVLFVDGRDQRRAAAELEQKLDTEIAARVYRARSHLRGMEGGEATVLNVADVLRDIGPVRDQPYPMGVFSEYGERTLESLLWELAATVADEERTEVLKALGSARALQDIEGEIETPMRGDPELKCRFILRVYEELDGAFLLERWDISRAAPVLDDEAATERCRHPQSLSAGGSAGIGSPETPRQ